MSDSYLYKARDSRGAVIQGKIRADSVRAAVEKLSSDGSFPLSLDRIIENRKKNGNRKAKIKLNELALFTRQTSDLLGSGLTLSCAMEKIIEQTGNSSLRGLMEEIHADINDGKSLSESLKKHSETFTPLYIGMVQSGEAGGILKEALENLSGYLEKEQEIRTRIVSAVAYPALVVATGLATIVFLFIFVIPRLMKIFGEMNQVLPLPTRILVGISAIILKYWYAAPILIAGAIIALKSVKDREKLKKWLDSLLIKLPLWGEIIKKVEIARISRTMTMCLKNGVPVIAALEVAGNVASNGLIKNEIKKIQSGVKEGNSMYSCLKDSQYFPSLLGSMIAIGEESNTLDRVFNKIDTNNSRDIDTAMKLSTALIEPMAILILGVIVCLIVVAILLPIFKMNFGTY